MEERIRNQTWITIVGGKSNKGHIYGIGQLTHNNNYVDKLIYHGSSSLNSDLEDFIQLKQQVKTYKESNERLSQQVQSLINIVQTLLPPDTRTAFQQQQEQPTFTTSTRITTKQ